MDWRLVVARRWRATLKIVATGRAILGPRAGGSCVLAHARLLLRERPGRRGQRPGCLSNTRGAFPGPALASFLAASRRNRHTGSVDWGTVLGGHSRSLHRAFAIPGR